VADESTQAQCVAEHVLAQRENGVGLKSQAVLFRTSSHSAQLELELTRRNIPFVKFGGLRFLDAAHVKDVLSVLRWIENPRGRIAGFRALRLLPGVGPATATRWLDAIDGAADALTTLGTLVPPAACAEALPQFAALVARLETGRGDWPAQMDWLLEWYEPHAERRYDDAAMRTADLAQLRRIAATFADRERFLTELTLDPPEAVSDEAGAGRKDDEYLTLSTIHSAKGQEWKVVQVLNCVDGCLPSDLATGRAADIEEERRLLYVAMTRARDELTLLVPQRFYVHQQRSLGDRYVQASRSRFLPEALACHFVQETWPVTPPASAALVAAAAPSLDLPARMRAAWKRPKPAPV
jgi:ATP-dependent DNA helicase UvrD/PcrA